MCDCLKNLNKDSAKANSYIEEARIVFYNIYVKSQPYWFRISGNFIIGNQGAINDYTHIRRVVSYVIGPNREFDYTVLNSLLLDEIYFSQNYYDKDFRNVFWSIVPDYAGYYSVLSDIETAYRVSNFYVKPKNENSIFRGRPMRPAIMR